jgi:hypothetical protein
MSTVNQINALTAKINAAPTCELLQGAAVDILAEIQEQIGALTSEIAKYAPLIELLEIPTDLGKLLTWVPKLINLVLQPMVQPYYTMATQLAELTAAVSQLTAAIESKASSIGNCSISI